MELTKEQIDDFRFTFSSRPDEEMMDAICDLALEALALRPRPISEAPKDGTRIYGWNRTYKCYTAVWWDETEGGEWAEVMEGGAWSETAFEHFLTSLPEPK